MYQIFFSIDFNYYKQLLNDGQTEAEESIRELKIDEIKEEKI